MNLPQLPFLTFLSGALALDNAPALCDDKTEKWMTYGELRGATKNLVSFWQSKNPTPKRSLILISTPRTAAGAVNYLAAAASGHALLLIDPTSMRPDLFIDTYQPEWILLSSALKPDGPYTQIDYPTEGFYLWERATPADSPIHEDLYILLLPPGPPESFKTVRISYKAMAHNTEATLKALGITGHDGALGHMPLSYSFGLSILHLMLCVGGRLFLSERDIKNRELWELVQKRDVTLFAGIPFHFEHLARAGLNNLHVPRLKTFLQAGGRMPIERTADILSQVTERNGAFFVLYGLTEASPRICCLPLHLRPDKIGSSGTVLEDGRLMMTESGLVYEGPNVMMGYGETRADLALGDTQQGRLLIHDPAHIDDEGFLFFDM